MHERAEESTYFSRFAFNLRVKANPYGDDITSKQDLTKICTSETYGAGFVGEFESDKRIEPSRLFKFFSLLDHGDSMQLWQLGGINHLPHLKKVITNVSAFDRISPTTVELLQGAKYLHRNRKTMKH